jgi:von Willebrand factor type A domain
MFPTCRVPCSQSVRTTRCREPGPPDTSPARLKTRTLACLRTGSDRCGNGRSADDDGDAIGLAIKQFANSDAKDRVLILLTDGNDTGSRMPPRKAAEIAKENRITIHVVGLGYPHATGEDKVDYKALHQIATATGGLLKSAAELPGWGCPRDISLASEVARVVPSRRKFAAVSCPGQRSDVDCGNRPRNSITFQGKIRDGRLEWKAAVERSEELQSISQGDLIRCRSSST